MATPAPPVILNATSNEAAVVIFLHHTGANGLSWAKRFETMKLPHVRYVFPNAPLRALSLYDGAQQTAWYDVHGYTNISKVDEEGLAEANSKLHKLIDEEIARGTPSERILLGGYSLGGCLALYSCITYPKPLAGVIVMNCWLADYRREYVGKKFHPSNLNTPALYMHGDTDPFIHMKYARLSYDICKEHMTKFTFKIYKNTNHWPTPEMFENMKKFISDCLPDISNAKKVAKEGESES